MNQQHPTLTTLDRNFLRRGTQSKAMRRASAEATAMMIMASQALYLGNSQKSRKKVHTSSPPKPYLNFRKRSQIAKSRLVSDTVQAMSRMNGKRARK